MSERMPKVGEHVMYLDEFRQWRDALITAPWSETCVNVVLVSDNGQMTDTYGRQVERQTSQIHQSKQMTADGFIYGRAWRFVDEEPLPVKHAPMAT